MIVRGDRVVSATCYLPLTDSLSISKDLGTRHRAAVGISEVSDSLTIVVSEETGKVSIAMGGELYRNVDAEFLKNKLSFIQHREKKVSKIELWRRRLKDVKESGKKLTNNLGLKVLAVLFAIALWIVVVNIDDPVKPAQYTISVTQDNMDYLTSNGKYSETLGGKIQLRLRHRQNEVFWKNYPTRILLQLRIWKRLNMWKVMAYAVSRLRSHAVNITAIQLPFHPNSSIWM